MGRTVAGKFEVAWDGTNFEDESSNIVSARGTLSLTPAGAGLFASRGSADSMSITLYDRGRRYNPLISGGAIYADIQNGKAYHRPARMSVQIDGGSWVRVFTGVLKLPTLLGPTSSEVGTVTFTVRSNEELLLNDRQSTTIAQMAAIAGADEATIIEYWLDELAGVSVLDMVIDPGMFQIPYAWLDDESIIEDCWQLAAACGGRFYVDVDGQFCYENAFHWLTSPHTTSQQTYSRTTDYNRLSILLDDGDLFSDITVVAAARTAGPVGSLWTPDGPIVVPASTTRTIVAPLRQPLAGVNGTLNYTVVTHGGRRVTSNVTVSSPTWCAQRATFTVANTNSYAIVLQQVSITGAQLAGGNQHEETSTSNTSFWSGRSRRVRRFTGNPYVQTPAQAAALAEMMRDYSQGVRLKYQLSNVVGNPERKIGDLVTISDTIMLAAGNRTAYITGLSWQWDSSGFKHTTIDLVDAATLYPYATSPGYFIIGSSLLGGTHKVFY